MTTVTLSIIVAVAENGVVGRDNGLPWHLPEDLKYFKKMTLGKPVVMGRKTYESIGRPLPERRNIVVSRQSGYAPHGVEVVASLPAALALAVAGAAPVEEVMVIGGAQIYREALPLADRLYVTEVHASVEGDAHFPAVDWTQWRECSRTRYEASEKNPYCYSFAVYNRNSQAE